MAKMSAWERAGLESTWNPTVEAKIINRGEHSISRKHFSESARKVLYRLNSKGYCGYLAGGAVRDILLDRDPKDFDVVTDARPKQIRRIFRNSRMIGRRFRLAHILFKDETIECATFRKQIDQDKEGPHKGKHFQKRNGMVIRDNVYGTPGEDAVRRDFTVNALFYDISDFSVIDYVGGMRDLKDRLIRCIGDPRVRYTEDPVRMIRALRFAAKLDFSVEEETYNAIIEKRELLANAAPARLYEEVQKLFFCGNADKLFEYLEDTGLFAVLFPDLSGFISENQGKRGWLQRVMRQLDKWVGAGKSISPDLLLALLYGPYYEEQAQQRQGKSLPQRLKDTALQHLNTMRNRIVIPKSIKYSVGHILADQIRLRNTKRKKSGKVINKRGFEKAFIYFKLRSRHTGEYEKAVQWWEKRMQKK